MAGDVFERLEKCNAQWDIWIDQEEYGKIKKVVSLDGYYHGILDEAFGHENCADDESIDKAWRSLFKGPEPPRITITRTLTHTKSRKTSSKLPYHTNWSHFFFAKFARARIQEKGSDCYFRRLDHVVTYLERHMPQVDRDDENANKLAVLYLLEMAAAGEGPDQRSFAERARKVLKDYFDNKTSFFKFYDLLARYNKGIGYQHEGRLRDAVLEFNYIIYKLKNIYGPRKVGLNYSKDREKLEAWKEYTNNRKGFGLIFLPAVIGRAAIQIKLQLAYHTRATLKLDKWSEWQRKKDKYINAKCNYLLAEACRLSGDFSRSEKCLEEIAKFLSGSKPATLNDYVTNLDIRGSNYQNIVGRLMDTLVALRLDQLRGKAQGIDVAVIPSLLEKYWDTAKISATNREGYLRLVAEIMSFLSKEAKDGRKDALETLQEVYVNNRTRLLENEDAPREGCRICAKKGIDLRRLRTSAYEDFREQLTTFFQINEAGGNFLRTEDKEDFRNRLIGLEKDRENLEWRKRRIEFVPSKDAAYSSQWCLDCLPDEDENTEKNELSFRGLLACCTGHLNANRKGLWLSCLDYESNMNAWDNHFLEHLKWRSIHTPEKNSIHFLGLQRWNSTSPAQGRSLGGGYLIYHTNERGCINWGIAIDPGFDFVRNLFHAGFSLSDIDLVLLSHAHIDHLRDFESMVNLYLELDKRTKDKRRAHVIMTLGVYHRLAHLIKSSGLRKYLEPYIVDIEKELDDQYIDKTFFMFTAGETNASTSPYRNALKPTFNYQETTNQQVITVKPIIAYHNDFTEYSDSFGFIIEIKIKDFTYCFGYTGDTSWDPRIMDCYKECDALLMHLGSLIDREKPDRRKFSHYSESEKCWELAKEKNHPYFMGMLHFLTDIQKLGRKNGKAPLILMSEFGEELRGRIRLDLVNRLNETYTYMQVLPVDVGLDVLLHADKEPQNNGDSQAGEGCGKGGFHCKKKSVCNGEITQVFCVVCNDFVSLCQVAFDTYGHDEALFCVCKTCSKSTPLNVLQERLRSLHETGRRLRKDDRRKDTSTHQ